MGDGYLLTPGTTNIAGRQVPAPQQDRPGARLLPGATAATPEDVMRILHEQYGTDTGRSNIENYRPLPGLMPRSGPPGGYTGIPSSLLMQRLINTGNPLARAGPLVTTPNSLSMPPGTYTPRPAPTGPLINTGAQAMQALLAQRALAHGQASGLAALKA